MKSLIVVGVITLMFTACTDAQRGKIQALGNSGQVECYSGGKLIYSGVSSGKITSEQDSDGYFFLDKDTGKFMQVSGNCFITYTP